MINIHAELKAERKYIKSLSIEIEDLLSYEDLFDGFYNTSYKEIHSIISLDTIVMLKMSSYTLPIDEFIYLSNKYKVEIDIKYESYESNIYGKCTIYKNDHKDINYPFNEGLYRFESKRFWEQIEIDYWKILDGYESILGSKSFINEFKIKLRSESIKSIIEETEINKETLMKEEAIKKFIESNYNFISRKDYPKFTEIVS